MNLFGVKRSTPQSADAKAATFSRAAVALPQLKVHGTLNGCSFPEEKGCWADKASTKNHLDAKTSIV